ncbi:MAG TPA: S41 family peptidase [Candidatus Copromorpha excrementipullorum]|uniref:S41 family peptidase n=1 Tax=Candidatus Allocopromorpha excrementipullorum TaxID=2840743 RepID=A0A9D1N8N3_9FIRM|nr:S41 family peptidase [Candidatus Copromorpha excrementipullorum]
MEIKKKRLVIYVVAAFLAGAAVTGGACAAVFNGALGYVKVSQSQYDDMSEVYERYGKLDQLYDTITSSFYKKVDEDAMMEGAYKGLVAGLNDPYSSYMTAEEYETWVATATGEYSGVGITFTQDEDGNFVVVSVTDDSPAADVGIREGDIIKTVDGQEYSDLDVIGNAIRGEEGSEIEITYIRDGEEKSVTMTREKITQHSVEHRMLDGNIGYISISSFIETTGEDFSQALKELEEDGAQGLVLDLRDNGGGLVDACVQVADEFLDEGVVVYVEDRDGNRTDYDAKDGKTDLKTVVLVNENSASASEILAAALQDNGFEIVGQTTYGKGVIQSTAQLEDGSALKLTIMQYFSPDGNAINEKGVTPDHQVANEENSGEDAQLDEALSLF